MQVQCRMRSKILAIGPKANKLHCSIVQHSEPAGEGRKQLTGLYFFFVSHIATCGVLSGSRASGAPGEGVLRPARSSPTPHFLVRRPRYRSFAGCARHDLAPGVMVFGTLSQDLEGSPVIVHRGWLRRRSEVACSVDVETDRPGLRG